MTKSTTPSSNKALAAKPSDKALVAAYEFAESSIERAKTVIGNEAMTSAGKETLKDIIKDSHKLLKQLDKVNIIEEEAAIAQIALEESTLDTMKQLEVEMEEIFPYWREGIGEMLPKKKVVSLIQKHLK